tara:strand:+ start:135 stop:533 length:399 start_codon:yes stop_codon:yes gene_type:complete
MKEIILKVEKIRLEDFDASERKGKFLLVYCVDGVERKRILEINLQEKIENLVEEILKIVKNNADSSNGNFNSGDDLIGSLFVKRFVNEDNTGDKIYNYLAKIGDKLRVMKIEKNHSQYMKIYHEIKGKELVL